MTELIDRLLIAFEVSRYPNYSQARAYLVNFLRRGKRAFIRTKRYAYYQHSPSLRVIVIRLVPGIFEVRAYPVDGFCFVTLEEVLKAEDFRAWLFALDYRTSQINYITGSQREGIELYKLIRLGIKKKGKLASASQSYLSIPTQG
ncbi:unnamed protein product [marine sediment metagenome]|uniref:Uncharacterized protein n=2 Tax=marine sediment metagenome TaxID=412755 RepID=X1FBN2_9ZZZZ